MTWLYGDSSKSPLDINFIDFLRLAMDFAVDAFLAEDRIGAGRERRYRLESEADGELARLEDLASAVAETVDAQAAKGNDSPTVRCAAAIGRAASEVVKREVAAVKSALSRELAQLEADATRERERCVKALEGLLCRYDLPDTKTTLLLELGATSHLARLRGVTSYGLETLLELEIDPANMFAHEVRVDRFIEGLEVKVPETGGWLRKQSRIVPHKLGKYRIARLSASGEETRVELRAGADAHAAGFHITVGTDKPDVRMAPIGRDEEVATPPFEPDAEDSAKLLQLSERLAGAVAELSASRKALLEAKLDGEPLAAHARPSTVVERLIAAMAPTVRAIAQHSLSPSELVLRRLLGGDRREEVFVGIGELVQKLDRLPAPRRAPFEALGLTEPEPDASARPPAMIPDAPRSTVQQGEIVTVSAEKPEA